MAKNTAIKTVDTLESVVYSIHIGALETVKITTKVVLAQLVE